MFQKRRFVPIFILILLLTLLPGCSPGADEKESPVAITFSGFTDQLPDNLKPLLTDSIFLNFTADVSGTVGYQFGYTIIDSGVREDHIVGLFDAATEEPFQTQQSYLLTCDLSGGLFKLQGALIGDAASSSMGEQVIQKKGLTSFTHFLQKDEVVLHAGEEKVLAGFVGSTNGLTLQPAGEFFNRYATIDEALTSPEMTDSKYTSCYYILFYATADAAPLE